MIWSYSPSDPADPSGNDLTDPVGINTARHIYQGSRSLNLIGGLAEPSPNPGNQEFLDVAVSNVSNHRDENFVNLPLCNLSYLARLFYRSQEVHFSALNNPKLQTPSF